MHRCGQGTGVSAGGQTRAYDNLGNEYSESFAHLDPVGPVRGAVLGPHPLKPRLF